MPEQEFELYLDLLARLLRMSPKQKEAIASELRDHLEARFEELVRAGTPRDKAIRQALEEFGDTAGLAHQFTQLSRRQMRRWIMRGTLATAAVGAVILLAVHAFLPERAGGPAPQQLAAQDDTAPAVESEAEPVDVPEWKVEYIDPVQFVHPDLAQPLDVVFDETPLADAMEMISQSISLPVVLDVANLLDEGIDADAPISDRFREDPLYLRLNRALANVERVPLDWYVDDDVLVVTTQTIADEHLWTIPYNVGDLLANGFSTASLIGTLQNETLGPWFDLDGIGGTISAFGEMLIIRQTEREQREVAALLESVRTRANERILRPAIHAQLEAALERPVNVDFDAVSLDEAIDSLQEEVNGRIRIDVQNLEDEGIGPDALVTLRMSNRPLRTVLKFMLDNVDGVPLSALCDDGTIVITTATIADETLGTVIFDVSELVGEDVDRSAELVDLIQNETSGPWFDLDGIGGTISTPLPGVLVIRQTDRVLREIRRLIKENWDAVLAARATGAGIDVLSGRDEVVDTRYYQMDADTARDLLTLLPEMVATGTWATMGDAEGVGVIRVVAAGRKVVTLAGSGINVAAQQDGPATEGTAETSPQDSFQPGAGREILIIPQAVLIVRHKPSVHREIREFLNHVAIDASGSNTNDVVIPALNRQQIRGGGGGGFGYNAGGGFFSVPDQQ